MKTREDLFSACCSCEPYCTRIIEVSKAPGKKINISIIRTENGEDPSHLVLSLEQVKLLVGSLDQWVKEKTK